MAAHAHGAQGIKNALVAGVDSIEHGSYLDDEGIQLLLKHGAWLVADIYNDDYLLGKAIEFKLPQESIDKERALGQMQRDNFARAVRSRREDRLWHRRGRLSARRQRQTVLLHGQVRADAGAGHSRGHGPTPPN